VTGGLGFDAAKVLTAPVMGVVSWRARKAADKLKEADGSK